MDTIHSVTFYCWTSRSRTSRCGERRGTADATSPWPSRSARDPAPPGGRHGPPSSCRAEEASRETAGGHDGGACLCWRWLWTEGRNRKVQAILVSILHKTAKLLQMENANERYAQKNDLENRDVWWYRLIFTYLNNIGSDSYRFFRR